MWPNGCHVAQSSSSVRNRQHACALLAVVGWALLLGGCSTFSEGFARVERQMAVGDVAGAQAVHAKLNYPERDRALQHLNQGMLARLNGDLTASNAALEHAKGVMEQFAKISVAEQATSLVTNDELRAYEGQVHERIYVHLIKAINYLQQNDRYAARVEILQVDVVMRELAASNEKSVARAAPFARYLSGLIYDALDERSDAMISYRQAYVAYQERGGSAAVPAALRTDLLRLSRRLGLSDEYERYRKEFGTAALPSGPAVGGEVVALVFDGLAPGLSESTLLWPQLGTGRVFRVSMPVVNRRSYAAGSPELTSDVGRIDGELADDLDALVRADLSDRAPAMAARAIARQVLKQGAATAVSKSAQRKADSSGEQAVAGLLSLGMQIAAVMTERADTRNWSTLPGKVWVIRQRLAPGEHRLRLELGGRTREFSGLRVASGEKVFVVWHPLGPGGALEAAK